MSLFGTQELSFPLLLQALLHYCQDKYYLSKCLNVPNIKCTSETFFGHKFTRHIIIHRKKKLKLI